MTSNVLDICVVCDNTTSMDRWIKGVKDAINSLVKYAKTEMGYDIRIAMVAYDDWKYQDNPERLGSDKRSDHIKTIEFTEKIPDFTKFVDSLKSVGGDQVSAPPPLLPLLPFTQVTHHIKTNTQ